MSHHEAKLRLEVPREPSNVDPPGVTVQEAEALETLARLNEALRARAFPEPAPVEPVSVEAPPAPAHPYLRPGRIIKTLLALAAAVALLWIPVQRLLYATSAQATVNARLINLRAPIDGTVSIVAPSIAVGTLVKPDETLLQVTNARADRHRLDDLRRTVSALRMESTALEKKLGQLKKLQADLKAQTDAFQQGRVGQLEARAAELEAEVKGAEARQEDALKSYNRSKELKERGHQTVATLLHAEGDYKVAKMKSEAARKRLESNRIELEGARKGFFVGDSYNDLPRTAQRLDEIEQQVVEASSQLEERQARIAFLEKEQDIEARNFASQSKGNVSATVAGRIWEVLAANGEQVHRGQDLLRILDCAGAVVTATVSESVYNKLWIGQPVEFTMRGESEPHAGTVVGLTGLAAAGNNFAIDQSAMTREPYHVTIAVPGLAAQRECNVGRTGSVTFEAASAASPVGPTGSAERASGSISFAQSAHAIAASVAAALRKTIDNVTPDPGLS